MQRESVARFIFFFSLVRNPTFSSLLDACDGEKIKDKLKQNGASSERK